MAFYSFLGFLLYFGAIVDSAKILGLFPVCGTSHRYGIMPLIKELASRGHDITLITTTKPGINFTNVIELDVPEVDAIFKGETNLISMSTMNPITTSIRFVPILSLFTEAAMSSSTMKQLIRKGKQYDLVLAHGYFNEAALMVSHLLGDHLVLVSPGVLGVYTSFPAPMYPSFVPNVLFSFPADMNFLERLQNFVGSFITHILHQVVVTNDAADIVFKTVPNALSPTEARQRVSLVLVNNDPVLAVPRPMPPRIVSVGGMHLRPSENIPQEISNFVKGSGKHGFIVFSLGSVVQPEQMPEFCKLQFLSAFSKLKQRVIWKYGGKIDKLPENVLITPWLQQQDILGHPQIKLFIGHGGLLSTQEAIYHGVPMIGVPVYGDQHGNIARIKDLGMGMALNNLFEATSEEIFDAINSIINNPRYKENAKKYSVIMRDEIESPTKRAAFWVEYVLRHNGAHHLKSVGDDQSFVQYYLIDILGFIIILLVLSVWTVVRLIVFLSKVYKIRRTLFKRGQNKKSN